MSRRPYRKWSVPCGLWGKRIPHREDSKYKTLRWEQAWHEESEGVRKVMAEGGGFSTTIRTLPLTIWEGRVLDCQQRNRVLLNAEQGTHCKDENQQAETPVQSLSRNQDTQWWFGPWCWPVHPHLPSLIPKLHASKPDYSHNVPGGLLPVGCA